MISFMGKENLLMIMERSIRETFIKVKLMDLEFLLIYKLIYMKENGKMTCKMEKEKKHMSMDQYFKAYILMERKMVKVYFIIQINPNLLVISKIIKFLVTVKWNLRMGKYM